MEQDMVHIDAPDLDPDIDRPNPQRAHHNTAVASVQELLNRLNLNPSMPQRHRKKLQIVTNLIQDIQFQKIPIGLAIPPNKFQTICQTKVSANKSRAPPHTTVFQMKFPH